MVFQDAGASLTPWLSVGELIAERLRGTACRVQARDGTRWPRCSNASGCLPRSRSHAQVSCRAASGSAFRWPAPPSCRRQCCCATSRPVRLDVSLAASVLNLIGDLRRSLDMSVVFVTHDLSVARVVADRIAVMYLGRIVEIGPAERVIGDPAHPYTQALVDSIPDLGRESGVLPGEPASPLSPPMAAPSTRAARSRSTRVAAPSSMSAWRGCPATRTRWRASKGRRSDGDRDYPPHHWSEAGKTPVADEFPFRWC